MSDVSDVSHDACDPPTTPGLNDVRKDTYYVDTTPDLSLRDDHRKSANLGNVTAAPRDQIDIPDRSDVRKDPYCIATSPDLHLTDDDRESVNRSDVSGDDTARGSDVGAPTAALNTFLTEVNSTG